IAEQERTAALAQLVFPDVEDAARLREFVVGHRATLWIEHAFVGKLRADAGKSRVLPREQRARMRAAFRIVRQKFSAGELIRVLLTGSGTEDDAPAVAHTGHRRGRREFADLREIREPLRPADVDDVLVECDASLAQREPRAKRPARCIAGARIKNSIHALART